MVITKHKYQFGFSSIHRDSMYDIVMREQKAKKILSVLNDFYSENLRILSVLDMGCSTGIISNMLSRRFGKVVGIDIDKSAVEYAKGNYRCGNLEFAVCDAMSTGFLDESFDVVICAHVYEHVPSPSLLIYEIDRLLKAGGVCYFAAGNRLNLIEPHYSLPLLSLIPKPLANIYLRILRRGEFYYENLLTFWGLKKLVSKFDVIDYTLKIIENPRKYCATEIIQPGSFKQEVLIRLVKIAYWLCPTYIWLLKKKKNT